MLRVVCAATLLVIATVGRAEIVNRIVATVDGEPITAHEVQRYADERGAEQIPASQVLDALITDKLLEKEASVQGIAARDDEIDGYIAQVKARGHMGDEQFKQALTQQGLTVEGYRAQVKKEIEKTSLVNREIRQRVNVSPQEIDRYYKAHLDDYTINERVKVRDIFFRIDERDGPDASAKTKAKAEEVRRLALDGRDFGALAAQFSEGPGADKGGLLGTFSKGEMESALDDAAFDLEPGRVSALVETPRGFHILRVDEVVPAGHKKLEDVQDEIRDALYGDAVQNRFSDFLARGLRERHHVEILN
jgi:peptidyl-prolyl cis-trans isomerase SurA